MIDYYKYSFFSHTGRNAGKQSVQEYLRTILTKCNNFLQAIKTAKAKAELENKGTEEKEMYL